jgi:hypothetical protein
MVRILSAKIEQEKNQEKNKENKRNKQRKIIKQIPNLTLHNYISQREIDVTKLFIANIKMLVV